MDGKPEDKTGAAGPGPEATATSGRKKASKKRTKAGKNGADGDGGGRSTTSEGERFGLLFLVMDVC